MSRRSGFWFLAVGSTAALVHVLVFAAAEHGLALTRGPELANALGFAAGFGVSFVGHRRLSFAATTRPVLQSLWRFALTAAASFASNELIFMALLRGLHWPSWAALLMALVLAAGQTFLLSRFWAFAR